jgi:peptidoglycan hydrolase CwlO-like protein
MVSFFQKDQNKKEQKEKFQKKMDLQITEEDLRKVKNQIGEIQSVIKKLKGEERRTRLRLEETKEELKKLERKKYELEENILTQKRKIY